MSLILSGTDGLSDVDGTAAAPAIRGTDANTGIFFPAADTIAFAEGGAEAMRIDSSGNVGIGTASPAGNLHVYADGTNVDIQTSNNSNFSKIRFKGSGGAVGGQISGLGGGSGVAFYYSTTEAARIDSSGNLLVGVTSSTATPAQGVVLGMGSGSAGIYIGHANGTSSGNFYMAYSYNGSAIGSITQNGTTAVAYNTSSDYRLKENIAPLTGALARVTALKPCTYTWKSAPDEIGEGFIAHELAEVVPQCVTGEKDAVEEQQYEVTPAVKDEEGNTVTEAVMGTRTVPKYQGIDTSFLVATLTAAIQEQQALITALTTRSTALEERLSALEAA